MLAVTNAPSPLRPPPPSSPSCSSSGRARRRAAAARLGVAHGGGRGRARHRHPLGRGPAGQPAGPADDPAHRWRVGAAFPRAGAEKRQDARRPHRAMPLRRPSMSLLRCMPRRPGSPLASCSASWPSPPPLRGTPSFGASRGWRSSLVWALSPPPSNTAATTRRTRPSPCPDRRASRGTTRTPARSRAEGAAVSPKNHAIAPTHRRRTTIGGRPWTR